MGYIPMFISVPRLKTNFLALMSVTFIETTYTSSRRLFMDNLTGVAIRLTYWDNHPWNVQ